MKVVIRLLVAMCIAATLQACGGSDRWRDYHALTCGTACNITYRSAVDLTDSITALLSEIESTLSVFDPASPISAINRGDSIEAPDMLRRIIELSRTASAESGGAFDPTVGPLIDLWGFGVTPRESSPSDAEIDSALASVGIEACAVLPDGSIQKKSPSTTFNFGAIGKGFAAQEVIAMLTRNGVTDCMVEVGGDLALQGVNPHGSKWVIQIDAPVDGNHHDQLTTIDITDCGIATSGNYRNYRNDTATGSRIGHTISPVTGRPVTTDVLSATVVTRDAADADALATACMVLGSSAALDMAACNAGVEIMLVTADTTASADFPWRLITSPGFPLPR